MSYYIQRRGNGYLETVDEFATQAEANKILTEYQLSDRFAKFYVTTVPCANWQNRN